MDKEIKDRIIKWDRLPIEALTPFQGELKKMSKKNRDKFRTIIIEKGFSFPMAVWDQGGKIFIIDGHQRLEVLKGLAAEGYEIPDVQCAFLEIKDVAEAKEMVSSGVSVFGSFTASGFQDFFEGTNIEFEKYRFQGLKFKTSRADKDVEIDRATLHTRKRECPECGHTWTDDKGG